MHGYLTILDDCPLWFGHMSGQCNHKQRVTVLASDMRQRIAPLPRFSPQPVHKPVARSGWVG